MKLFYLFILAFKTTLVCNQGTHLLENIFETITLGVNIVGGNKISKDAIFFSRNQE